MEKIKPSLISIVVIKNTLDGPRYLFIKRIGNPLYGTWQYVTGGIEEGETATDAAIRELFEETSLIPSRMYLGDFVESFYDPNSDRIYFSSLFVAFVEEDQKVDLHPKEHDQYQWLTLEEAVNRSIYANQKAVLEHVETLFIKNTPHDRLRLSMRRCRKPLFETDRLCIYPLQEDDLLDLSILFSDPDVMRFSNNGQLPIEAVKNNLESLIQDSERLGFGSCAVCLKNNNQFIGRMGLILIEIEGSTHLEFEYRLAKKFWNLGYATEAAQCFLANFKKTDGSFPIISSIQKENHSSLKLAKKLGAIFYKEISVKNLTFQQYKFETSKG